MVEPGGRRLGATIVALFFIGLLMVFIARVATVVFLLFIATLLGVYLSATTDTIVRRSGLPRGGALAVAAVGTLALLTGVGFLILPPVVQQTQELITALPVQAQRLEALLERLARQYPILERSLAVEGGGFVESLVRDATNFVRGSLVPYLRAGGALAVETFSVLAMAIYLSREPAVYREGLIALVPPRYRHIARATLADLSNTMRAWVWAQLLAMFVLAVLTVIGLAVLQVPYPLAFGVFTGVVAIVPFFGSVVSTLLPALFVLINTGWIHGLAVALLGVAVHLVEANVVAPLIFQQFENIVKLTRDKARPVQFIFAGKAHPRDDDGKRFIQHIIHLSRYSELKGHLVFIENYDVHVARQMVSGCDVWLNNPRRPLEASGTSGMKASCHGGLNFSILDGWWREGYDGTNGFAIGDDSHPDNVEEQDRRDSENLYKTLTEEVIPCFFNRDANGIPRQWIQKIRRAMLTLVPQFNTWRMVQEYATKYYLAT